MKVLQYWRFFFVLLLASVDSNKTTAQEQFIDSAFTKLLIKHSVSSLCLSEAEQIIETEMRKNLPADILWGGINLRKVGCLSVYVVDASVLAEDSMLCGHSKGILEINSKNLSACVKAKLIKENCIVIDGRSIAIDIRLLWRVFRYSAALSISSLQNPATKSYYFPRDSIRKKFLKEENKFVTADEMLINLNAIDSLFKKGMLSTVKETKTRVLHGFLQFIFLHELGHIVNGHVNGSLLSCMSAKDPDNLKEIFCNQLDSNEATADDFAISRISLGLKANYFTPERASPEFFLEEFLRHQYYASLDIGVDPDTWDFTKASNDEKNRYIISWLKRISTGSHPSDLKRYKLILDKMKENQITLTTSAKGLEIVSQSLAILEQLCD